MKLDTIVKELRGWDATPVMHRAADHIEALSSENERLRAFVQFCSDGFFTTDDELQGAARAALSGDRQ